MHESIINLSLIPVSVTWQPRLTGGDAKPNSLRLFRVNWGMELGSSCRISSLPLAPHLGNILCPHSSHLECLPLTHPLPTPPGTHCWPKLASTTYHGMGPGMVTGGLCNIYPALLTRCCKRALQHVCNTLGQHK